MAIADIQGTDAGGYVGSEGSELTAGNIRINRITATNGQALAFQTLGTDTRVEGDLTVDTVSGVTGAYGIALGGGNLSGSTLRISNVRTDSEKGETVLADVKEGATLSFDNAVLTPFGTEDEWSYRGAYAAEAPAQAVNVQNMAVRSLSSGEVNFTNPEGSYAIAGTIVAGRGLIDTSASRAEGAGGTVSIAGKQVQILGDIYAGNGGRVNLTLNTDSVLEGQVDDYRETS